MFRGSQYRSPRIYNIRYFHPFQNKGKEYNVEPAFTKKIPFGDDKERHICDHCGMIHYNNPKVVSAVVAAYKDKVLLAKRNINPGKGLWALPGGFLESGEAPEMGAKREVWEEVGVIVDVGELLGVYSVPFIDQVMMYYRGELESDQFDIGIETQEAKLFDFEEIEWETIAFPSHARSVQFWKDNRYNNAVDVFTYPASARKY